MPQTNPKLDRRQLEQAIVAQEMLRGTVADSLIDATIAVLREQLAELEDTERVQEQRKLVTILFMDIAGSTTIVRDLDPEDNMAIMDTALQYLAAPVEAHGGRVTRFMGDGFIALFGAPVARENDPEMAVRAGLGILSRAQSYAQEIQATWGVTRFNVRVGINTGLVMLGGFSEAEDTIMGAAVNLAARLESAADPGTMLISQDTYQHVRELFEMHPLEPIAAKGFSEPVPVYRVLKAKPQVFRTRRGVAGIETRMVGRTGEMTMLQEAYREVVASGKMKVITLVGEAGLGKSRLMYEFEDWLETQPENYRLFKSRSRPETQGTPYGLLRNLFAFQFEIWDEEPTLDMRTKLETGLQQDLGIHALGEMKTHFIGQMLGYNFGFSPHLKGVLDDPRQIHDRALSYLADYTRLITASAPMVVMLDDIHWGDDSSLDAIRQFALSLPDQPVLILAVARPDLYERRPDWDLERPFYQRLDLVSLSIEESRQLILALLSRIEHLPEPLEELVVGNAGGNPFFLEEIIKKLIDDGVIIQSKPQWEIRTGQLTAKSVPQTLTEVLQARLDRLLPHHQQVLHQAAIVGRVFWNQVIYFMNQAGFQPSLEKADVHQGLASLVNREMIFEQDNSEFSGTRKYIFKHAILREVAYERVLKRHRPVYHGLVANWLIENGRGRENELLGQIADHLVLSEKPQRACSYLLQAGERAARQYANEEAISYFSRALDLVSDTDLETCYALRLARERVYDLQGKREAQAADLAALETLSQALGEPERQAEVALREADYAEKTSAYPQASATAQRAVTWAQAAGNVEQEASGYLAWGRGLWRQGLLDEAHHRLSQALDLGRANDLSPIIGAALRNLGVVVAYQGDFPAAQDYYEQARTIFHEVGDRRNESRNFNSLGNLARDLGDYTSAQDYFEKSLAIDRALGDRHGESWGLNNLGVVAVEQGNFPAAKDYYQQALEIFRAISDRRGESGALGNLGALAGNQGEYQSAHDYFEQTLFIARQIGARRAESQALFNLGVVAAEQEDFPAARDYYEQALVIFREIDNRRGEAEVLTRLGDALMGLHQRDEAQAAFQGAVEMRETLGQLHLEMESRAGLARLALAQGEIGEAQTQVARIHEYLDAGNTLDGTEAPLRILLTCYQVFYACQDPRAQEILVAAHNQLQEQVAKLTNETARRSFLENVPWNREILRLWEKRELG